VLVHVIDASEGDPLDRFRTIDAELSEYGAGLDERPQVVVLNKLDLLTEPPDFPLEDDRVQRVLAVSCVTGEGIHEFRRALFELCPAAPAPQPQEDGLADFLVYRPRAPGRPSFRILRTDSGFRVAGTPPDERELEEALRAAGAKPGDEVEVGGELLEYS
jgi:GTP-binding protein